MSSRILVLSAKSYNRWVFRALRAMGVETVTIDRNPQAGSFSEADFYEVVDIVDRMGALDVACRYCVDAVMAINDFGVRTAAFVAQRLGLVGLTEEVANVVCDKGLMRDAWVAAGLPQPAYKVVADYDEAIRVAKEIGFPLVIKPTDCGGGQRGVSVVTDLDELPNAFYHAQRYVRNRRIIIEEYVEGIETQIESLTWKGVTHTLTIPDKGVTHDRPYRVTQSINFPGFFSSYTIERIRELTARATAAVGITVGAAHPEMIVKPDGEVVLLEIAGRPGGGPCFSPTPFLVCGVDMVQELAKILLGEQPNLRSRRLKGAVIRFLFPPSGRVREIRGVREAWTLPGIVDIQIDPQSGSVLPEITSGVERAGYIVATGATREEAIAVADAAERTIVFEMER
ncbi:MAG: ATP-grasp domain-containing protein [Chloroflexota bacterium]